MTLQWINLNKCRISDQNCILESPISSGRGSLQAADENYTSATVFQFSSNWVPKISETFILRHCHFRTWKVAYVSFMASVSYFTFQAAINGETDDLGFDQSDCPQNFQSPSYSHHIPIISLSYPDHIQIIFPWFSTQLDQTFSAGSPAVVLEPQWLLDAMAQVVACPRVLQRLGGPSWVESLWTLVRISMESLWNICGISMESLWNLYGISNNYRIIYDNYAPMGTNLWIIYMDFASYKGYNLWWLDNPIIVTGIIYGINVFKPMP